MQISKYFLAAAIFAAGLAPIFGQSGTEESDDRDKAREELNRKMAELEAQLQSTDEPKPLAGDDVPTKSVEMPNEAVEPPKTVEPAVTQPIHTPVVETPVVETPVVVPKPIAPVVPVVPVRPNIERQTPSYPPIATEDAVERARQEMRRKIAELNTQDHVSSPKPTVVPSPAPKSQPKPIAPTTSDKSATMTIQPTPVKPKVTIEPVVTPKPFAPPAVDDAAIARARAETRRKIAELDAQDNIGKQPVTVTPSTTAPKSSATLKPTPTLIKEQPAAATMKPTPRTEAEMEAMKASSSKVAPAAPTAASLIQAPPPAVSAAKQARLNELLSRYRADKITPEQYHTERARILAE